MKPPPPMAMEGFREDSTEGTWRQFLSAFLVTELFAVAVVDSFAAVLFRMGVGNLKNKLSYPDPGAGVLGLHSSFSQIIRGDFGFS